MRPIGDNGFTSVPRSTSITWFKVTTENRWRYNIDLFCCALRNICPRDISNKSIMLSKSLTKVCVWGRGGGGWGLFYCTTEAASVIKGVTFCRGIRGNYATKHTVAECGVKRLCLGCVDEL